MTLTLLHIFGEKVILLEWCNQPEAGCKTVHAQPRSAFNIQTSSFCCWCVMPQSAYKKIYMHFGAQL